MHAMLFVFEIDGSFLVRQQGYGNCSALEQPVRIIPGERSVPCVPAE